MYSNFNLISINLQSAAINNTKHHHCIGPMSIVLILTNGGQDGFARSANEKVKIQFEYFLILLLNVIAEMACIYVCDI